QSGATAPVTPQTQVGLLSSTSSLFSLFLLPFSFKCRSSLSFLNQTLRSSCAKFRVLSLKRTRLCSRSNFRKSAARTFICNKDGWKVFPTLWFPVTFLLVVSLKFAVGS